jgi:glucose-1-phosphate thymidylyltransferase
VACHYLLESMRLAGITKAFIVLRKGKWDIPAYLGDGRMLGMHLAYLMMGLPFGAPYTLDQAYAFVQHALVAFGFPDIITEPDDAFVRLLERQAETNADVVLGLFVPDQPQKWDMVDLDDEGRIREIVIKPAQTDLRYAWCIAVWTPTFTHFMHAYLGDLQKPGDRRELYVGDVIQAAIDRDMRVEAVCFSDGVCLDIGTPDALLRAVRDYTPLPEDYVPA